MKIAQVAPLDESVPPKLYGGTERVIHYLTEELVSLGHDVTLFASGDSKTKAELVPIGTRSLRLDKNCADKLSHHLVLLERVAQHAHEFDVIHWHIDFLHCPVSHRLDVPSVTTLHGRLDLPDLAPVFREFGHLPLVSISDSQRSPAGNVNWIDTVYHGLPMNLHKFHPEPGKYLTFLGRISRDKRLDRAIGIAKKFGMPLQIAAKIDPTDIDYYEKEIHPHFNTAGVEFIGEIGEREKNNFLGNSYALLFPIDWPEPFGLVMIEAMACGTPVIAFRNGSVPEVMKNGVTGYVVDSVDEAVEALKKLEHFDRKVCREYFETHFSSRRMAEDYVRVYQKLLKRRAVLNATAKAEKVVAGYG